MPLYEYQCDACGQRFEVIQKFSETTEVCRRCGKGPVHRLLSSPAIQFKGSGFYITDYAQKGKSEGGGASSDSKSASSAAASSSSADSGGKTESKSESKSETKSDSKSDSSSSTSTPAKSDS
jgi:putative FmdB family regulatory protein